MINGSGNPSQQQEGIFRGVLLAYLVLVLHVVLIFGLGLLMFLFGGVVAHLPWILGVGCVLVLVSAYIWWKHMKRRASKIREVLNDPLYRGRSVELSFMGGLVSLKLGQAPEPLAIDHSTVEMPRQIVDPATQREEELTRLAHLLKEDLITIDEYLKAKKELTGQ
jgi:hypothetical protein